MITGNDALKILREGIQLPNGLCVRFVEVGLLDIDPTYQRGIVSSTVDKIRREFDDKALGVIEVGARKRTKKNYVVDGQNRVAAVKARHAYEQAAPEELLCLIHPDTTKKIEAGIFVKRNTAKPVQGNAKFRANLTRGEEPETLINKIVEEQGFSLDFVSSGYPNSANTSINGIRSPYVLVKVYKDHYHHIQSALMLLRLAYGIKGRADTVPMELRTGTVIQILAKFLSGQVVKKDIKVVAEEFKARTIDLGSKLYECRSMGYAKIDLVSDWLTEMVGGSRIKLGQRTAA